MAFHMKQCFKQKASMIYSLDKNMKVAYESSILTF